MESTTQAPDLNCSLVGILTRFRQEPAALMADIVAMLPEEQRDFFRSL